MLLNQLKRVAYLRLTLEVRRGVKMLDNGLAVSEFDKTNSLVHKLNFCDGL